MIDDTEITGGPAFPAMEIRTHDTQDIVQNASQGLSILDYFAAKSLQGLIGNISCNGVELRRYMPMMSAQAFDFAAAMLAERKKRTEQGLPVELRAALEDIASGELGINLCIKRAKAAIAAHPQEQKP